MWRRHSIWKWSNFIILGGCFSIGWRYQLKNQNRARSWKMKDRWWMFLTSQTWKPLYLFFPLYWIALHINFIFMLKFLYLSVTGKEAKGLFMNCWIEDPHPQLAILPFWISIYLLVLVLFPIWFYVLFSHVYCLPIRWIVIWRTAPFYCCFATPVL